MAVVVERVRVSARRLREPRVALVALAAAVAGVVLLTVAAFALDEARRSGEVARGVHVGGRDVGGASRERLASVLAEVDGRYATTEVKVDVEGGEPFTTDAGTIGLRVDPVATAERALDVGRTGSLPSRWWSWLGSFRGERRTSLDLSVDRAAVERLVAEKATKGSTPPTEARIERSRRGPFVGVAGKAGEGIDAGELADALATAAAKGTPIEVKAKRGQVQPRFSKADADALAARAEELVEEPLPLAAGGTSGTLSTGTMRTLIASVPGATALELKVDEAAAGEAASKALVRAGSGAREPTFAVAADGSIQLVPGEAGLACCGDGAGAKVAAAVLQRPEGPVQLELVERQPRTSNEKAASFGVKEKVSTFTTKHPCCANRVKNIQRMADLVRGQVIPPGGSFSINGAIGPRTTEKGFLADKVIEDGFFTEDVGGGVSQFATTLFNAAWFAGLEFGEYQSHSLYVSRYPYGREATLGFPHPDLVVKNPSPHGVLIWPTYTGTSITVDLYSTKWVASVQVAGQDKVPNGSCTKVITKRSRTFLDGRVDQDTTVAQYRAAEGQNCNQDQPSPASTTTRPGSRSTTTTTRRSTTTKAPSTTAKPASTTAKP